MEIKILTVQLSIFGGITGGGAFGGGLGIKTLFDALYTPDAAKISYAKNVS
jgi:hypothetical protein